MKRTFTVEVTFPGDEPVPDPVWDFIAEALNEAVGAITAGGATAEVTHD